MALMKSLPKGLSAAQVLGRFVDLRDYTPNEPLLRWLAQCGIKHNGLLDGEEGAFPLAIVHATQRHFQRYHSSGIPMARTEIDLRAEDAQHTRQEKQQRLRALIDLGLFYHDFAPPTARLDCLLWHAAYLPELLHQYDTLMHHWQCGVRWEKLVFLGAECSVGTDLPADQLLKVGTSRHEYRHELRDVYSPNSLYWYAPCAALVEKMWNRLPKPASMREAIDSGQMEVQWIAAPDTYQDSKRIRLANTQDTLTSFARTHNFDSACRYGLCTRAPTALRQWLITMMFLCKHALGFSLESALPVICARRASPTSLYVAEREAANVL